MSQPTASLVPFFVPHQHHAPPLSLLSYRLLSPAVSAGGRLPLVVLLHGAGERGHDNLAQLGNGVADWLGDPSVQAAFPCHYLLPQCPAEARWVEVDWAAPAHTLPVEPSRPMAALLDLLPQLFATLPIDLDRVYLVGLSMGGFGVYDLLSRRPDWFAAAVPICGGADLQACAAFATVPIWAFHGDRDPVISVERSRQVVRHLQALLAAPRYTELPGIQHDAWTPAFAHPALRPWLFAQHRRAR